MATTRAGEQGGREPGSRHRVVTLTLLLSLTALATGAVTVFFMYQTALGQTRHALMALADGEARLLTAVAREVRLVHSAEMESAEVLRQAREIVSTLTPGDTALEKMTEVWVLRREGGALHRVLSRSRTGTVVHDEPWPLLEQVELHAFALAQRAGTIMLHDAAGDLMMATYEPVPLLDAGVLARMPMRDAMRPLFVATAASMGVALLLILGGAALFMRKLNPMLLRVERSEARLRSVVTNAAEGIITIDESGTIMEFNRAAEEIFGYSAQEAIGQPLELIIPSPHRSRHQGYILQYLAGGEAKRLRQRTEFVGTRRDGSQFVMELAVSEAHVGKQRLFTGIINDITARREAEDALYEAKAELERRVTERTAELMRYNQLLQAMHEVQNAYFANGTPHGVFDYALHTLFSLTASSGGFLAELSEAEGDKGWLCYLASQERAEAPAVEFTHIAPQWEELLARGEAGIVSRDVPLLLLPLHYAGGIVGVAVVGGRTEPYSLELAEWLEPFLGMCGTLIHQSRLRSAAERANGELLKTERELDGIVRNVQDVIFRTDMAGTLRWISPSIFALSGRLPEQVNGWSVARHMVEHGIMDRMHDALRQDGRVRDFEMRLRHVDGSVRWMSANCHYLRDEAGRATGIEGVMRDVTAYKEAVQRVGELNRLYGVLRETNRAIVDITERKRLYQAICRSLTTTGGFLMAWIGELDGQLQRVVPVSYDGFEHGYLHALRAISIADAREGRGPTAQAVISNEIMVVNDIAMDPRMEPWRDAALSRGYRSSVALPFRAEGRPVGALMVYAETPGYFTTDMLSLLSILADDISHALDVQAHERDRQATTARLRDLALHLEAVREHERAHLAREIHDDLGGLLTAIKMDIAWLRRRCPATEEIANEKMGDMTRLADHAIQSMRRIITELRPSILDDLGLIPAVEWQLNEFRKRTGMETVLHQGLEPDVSRMNFPDTVAVAAFRTLQEALTNILKHADARRVVVDAHMERGDFVLSITDDGRGVEPEQLRKHGSYGILGMRERAQSLHGTLDIHSTAGQGMTVVLRLPLSPAPIQGEMPL